LERGNHLLPGPPPGQLAKGQGNQNRERQLTQDPEEANIEQYHVFITQNKDKRDDN
jgi:hypothetical protein